MIFEEKRKEEKKKKGKKKRGQVYNCIILALDIA
jgi:hypothetical protein